MPADLTQRPDIAAMQETIPRPDPRSATRLQAEAQRVAGQPYVTFGGTRWYISGQPDVFDLAEVGETINRAEEGDVLPALGASNKILRRHLKDYIGFREKFRASFPTMSEQAMEALSGVLQQFMEAVSGNPTGEPAGSSDGRSSTSTTSKAGSPSPAAGTSPAGDDWATYTPA